MDDAINKHFRGEELSFACRRCKKDVPLSLTTLLSEPAARCAECGQEYDFSGEELRRQLGKFVGLCRQLRESEEILSNVTVGIDVGPHAVKMPFKVLLTRLNNTLRLEMEGEQMLIHFRVEPNQRHQPAEK